MKIVWTKKVEENGFENQHGKVVVKGDTEDVSTDFFQFFSFIGYCEKYKPKKKTKEVNNESN